MKTKKKKRLNPQAISTSQSAHNFSYIAVTDELKNRALKLSELGAQLTNVAQRHDVELIFVITTIVDETTAASFRDAILIFNEFTNAYDNSQNFDFLQDNNLGVVIQSVEVGDPCFITFGPTGGWRFDYDDSVGRAKCMYSEYALTDEEFPDFPALIKRLRQGRDPVSRYIWSRCSCDLKMSLLSSCAKISREAWQKKPWQEKSHTTFLFSEFLSDLLREDWFEEWMDGEKWVDGIADFKLSDTANRLRAVVFSDIDMIRLNRYWLKEVYPKEIGDISPSRHVILNTSEYLNREFWSIVSDVVKTQSAVYSVPVELMAMVTAFVDAYRRAMIIKLNPFLSVILSDEDFLFFGVSRAEFESHKGRLDVKRSGKDIAERFEATFFLNLVQDAHEKLLDFLALLMEGSVSELSNEFTLSGNSMDVELRQGQTVIKLSTAHKRTMACLALLSKDEWFSVDAFSRNYFGKKPVEDEARKDFARAICALRSPIPTIHFEADHKGNRRFEGFTLKSMVSPEDLEVLLTRLRTRLVR